ncbi:subclass B3 metallo-beta-lactamase [Mucilaginibacter myungsuensis]|uniref:Subclass B3 metallo-beta-lactamase n=1 Tax=Mucilaginibacter myungsuensis TaxID=649104 RepID=A0A929KXY1_9SPHI|nr:subclass B3 metallo-beta-lactamase [Mucilaginibacter myungsuensis]MBE9660660.1 subclass B3 metallo-beta-lactamase [Mucilaginibacter myungsuensis]MDN3600705.1 subclass B3 metallo-beta-lactamase [Mucilaginibacter myungsuensis]
MTFRAFIFTILITGTCTLPNISFAQTVNEPKNNPAEWSRPYQPFRIAGNLYYVGTYDLGCFLITTDKGNILINTGLANSDKIIANNIRTLGFKLSDTKILLTTQAHFDHMGAMAALKKLTGAKVYVNAKDAQVMKDGGASDYALGNGKPVYTPVTPDKLLHDGDVITLGATKLAMLDHPGHTQGSCSYMLTTSEGKRTYRVLIANMPTIVTEKPFGQLPSYPTVEKDYVTTLRKMKTLKFDIWVSSHASQFGLHQKHTPGDAYDPAKFVDQAGYEKALNDLQAEFDKMVGKKK